MPGRRGSGLAWIAALLGILGAVGCESAAPAPVPEAAGLSPATPPPRGGPPPLITYVPREFTVLYSRGAVQARDVQAAYIILQMLEYARRSSSPCVHIVGHTDTIGEPQNNRALSLARAEMLAEDLRLMGVTAPIRVEGRGDTDLARPTPDEVDEPLNRRVTVLFCLPQPPPPVSAEPVAKAREPGRRRRPPPVA